MAELLGAIGGPFGMAMAVGGTILSGIGAIQQGNAAEAAAKYNAAVLEQRGQAENAAAQQEAQEERRQKELLISRARAVGAASGGGVDFDILGEIEEEGEMRALTAEWRGEEAKRGRFMQADSERFSGRQQKRASRIKAGSTLLSKGASFYDKYGS